MATKSRTEKQMTACTVRLPWDVLRAGKIRAIEEHRDFQDIVADALKAYLAKPLKEVRHER